jgi:GAF domain-containing protein
MKRFPFNQIFINPIGFFRDERIPLRERILTALLGSAAIFGLIVFLGAIGSFISRNQWGMVFICSTGYLLLVLITLLNGLPYWLRAGAFLLLLFGISLVMLLDNALSGSGRVLLSAFIAISGLLLGLRAGLAAAALSTATLAVVGLLMTNGRLPLPPVGELANSAQINAWLIASAVLLLVGAAVVFPLTTFLRGLDSSLKKERELNARLEQQRAQLEEQVQQRTAELQQRLLQIRASSELAYVVGNAKDVNQLLQGAVELIARRYDFIQAEIFLASQQRKHTQLQEYVSSGQARVKVSEIRSTELPTTPAQVVLTKQVYIHREVENEPHTAEIGVPVASGGDALGALVLRAESPEAFSNQVVEDLQTLGSQLAVAVQNIRLKAAVQYDHEDMQKRLKVLETLDAVSHAISIETDLNSLYRVIHEQVAWVMGEVNFMIALHNRDTSQIEIPYAYEDGEYLHIPPFPLGQGLTSILIHTGRPLLLSENVAERAVELGALIIGAASKSWLGVPLLVAGSAIGAMIVQDLKTESRFNEEDQRLLENMAAQIAVMVRNTRLLEEARQRAERERMINAINSKIRRSVDLNTVLKTTAVELTRALGARRVRIEIDPSVGQAEEGSNG